MRFRIPPGWRRGCLRAVSDSGFELQTEREGRIDTGQISFERVKQVRDLDQKSFGHSLGKGFLIAAIVIEVRSC